MDLANYSILEKKVFDNVYEPAEDTFILVDALELDQNLIESIRPRICLEIGCGSGVVITTLGKVLGSAYYLCTDLNPLAAEATMAVSKSNNVSVDVVVTDLVSIYTRNFEKIFVKHSKGAELQVYIEPVQSLRGCLENSIDLIICNPPYAVTPNEEVGGDNLQKATSGGERGRKVIDRLFPIVPKFLSPSGLFYLTCIYENDINDIAQNFEIYNLKMTVVLERRCNIERLFVLRFSFKDVAT